MSVLVVGEISNGSLRAASKEAAYYGHLTAQKLGGECTVLLIGEAQDASELGVYGANKVLTVDPGSEGFDSRVYADIIKQTAQSTDAKAVIFMHSSTGKSLAGRVSVALGAGLVSGATSIPEASTNGYSVSKSVFSGKAIATYEITSPTMVISVMGNSFKPEAVGAACEVTANTLSAKTANTQILGRSTQSGTVPLPEAELVISAGRGMKGPENWGIIEELADCIGATTACSRPVADIGWRPHHEHVGQTGVAIRPNLYIAIGISGAIQHLAGVNNSKVIVVINKDPEAPFFKAADYGVCADLFDVVPRLTAALKNA